MKMKSSHTLIIQYLERFLEDATVRAPRHDNDISMDNITESGRHECLITHTCELGKTLVMHSLTDESALRDMPRFIVFVTINPHESLSIAWDATR